MQRAVLFSSQETPSLAAQLPGHSRMEKTRQHRTCDNAPVSTIDFIDLPLSARFEESSLPLVDGGSAGKRSVSLYTPVTERLTRSASSFAGKPGTYFFLSFVNGQRGFEAEYDRWYLDHHLHEILAAPDFVAAQRFTLERALREDLVPAYRFLAIYELATDDLARSIAALESYLLSGATTPTQYKDPSRRLQVFMQAAGTESAITAAGSGNARLADHDSSTTAYEV